MSKEILCPVCQREMYYDIEASEHHCRRIFQCDTNGCAVNSVSLNNIQASHKIIQSRIDRAVEEAVRKAKQECQDYEERRERRQGR